jgi:hypothetical protein
MPPVTTVRQTPLGIRLDDGHSTKIAFERDPDISFWEKTVKPPGIDGGDAVDIQTMHNVTWRPRAPRQLKTLTDLTLKVAYDPAVFTQILALCNVEGSITCIFPDGSTYSFFGFLRVFDPDDNAEGTQPTATITITPTNVDPVTGAEAGPVLIEVAGT